MLRAIEHFIRNFGRKTYTVKIVYKSGHVETVRCTECRVQYDQSSGQVVELTLDSLDRRFVFAGINNIESIWRV